jgi:hypothetical protein
MEATHKGASVGGTSLLSFLLLENCVAHCKKTRVKYDCQTQKTLVIHDYKTQVNVGQTCLSDPRRLDLTASQIQSKMGLTCLPDTSKRG